MASHCQQIIYGLQKSPSSMSNVSLPCTSITHWVAPLFHAKATSKIPPSTPLSQYPYRLYYALPWQQSILVSVFQHSALDEKNPTLLKNR